ncbi:helix-turn-helix domain-containing protein [Paenibacillus tundrae]
MNKNQQWLADKMGLPKQRISDIVNLKADNITIQRAALIAYHLECGVDDLWKWGWR